MNVGEVINNMPGKTTGKTSINGKSINLVDFKKLVSGLFSSKKDKSDMGAGSDILSLLISLYSSGNLSEKGMNPNEINTQGTDKIDISSIISKLNLDDLLSKNQMTLDNVTAAGKDNIKSFFSKNLIFENINSDKADNINSLLSESLNIPENEVKNMSSEDFKKKLTEFISKINKNDKSQAYESTKLEDYGNFKKTILINRRNDMLSLKEEPVKIETDNMRKQSVSNKETNEAKESIKVKDSEEDVFSSVINKLELKNTSIKGETKLPEIRKQNLNEDVIKTISFMKDNDIKNLTVKVVPKELGEITIELIYTGDKINAKLTSSSNSTFQLLDQNMSILNSELSKNGVNLQNVNVSLYSGDFSEKERNQGQEYKRRDERKQVQEISSDEPIDEFSNINIFA
ncbi:MAG: flagellar hook-length control protein FliK [Bacillota bacterium]|nr:flagellar hook-length control protein FliK [Bacillota bacterium]